MRIFKKATPADVAYMVTRGAYDDYTVLCVCADQRTARQRVRKYNKDNPVSYELDRARVEEVEFIS